MERSNAAALHHRNRFDHNGGRSCAGEPGPHRCGGRRQAAGQSALWVVQRSAAIESETSSTPEKAEKNDIRRSRADHLRDRHRIAEVGDARTPFDLADFVGNTDLLVRTDSDEHHISGAVPIRATVFGSMRRISKMKAKTSECGPSNTQTTEASPRNTSLRSDKPDPWVAKRCSARQAACGPTGRRHLPSAATTCWADG